MLYSTALLQADALCNRPLHYVGRPLYYGTVSRLLQGGCCIMLKATVLCWYALCW